MMLTYPKNDLKKNSFLTYILRGFFRLLYHEIAWSYDYVAWVVSLGKWRSWVLSCVDYLSGFKVLELGHGPGHLIRTLSTSGKNIIGLDQSRQMGRQAYNRLRKAGISPQIIRGDAKDLPFPSNTFDHIVSTFPSDFIFIEKTLLEAKRVILPGGTLVVVPVAWINGPKLKHKLAARLFRVTGQAPEVDFQVFAENACQPFKNIGFDTFVEAKEVGASIVMIIIAKKPIE